MAERIVFSYDDGIHAFDGAGGVVEQSDDGVNFAWDEQHVVHVDAPADISGAFDTDSFYKITDATIARPIKQRYMVDGEMRTFVKPAAELRKAAWTFDNATYPLTHPDTGMVKDVNDVHGFWRNVRYDDDSDRLLADLYVPTNDDEAIDFIQSNTDVSVGFFNRLTRTDDYDGDVGDLVDDMEGVDAFQTDIFGNHVAGVKRGRCSGEDGCGLDHDHHGEVIHDAKTTFEQSAEMTEGESTFSEGDEVSWLADAVVAHNPDDESGVMIEILDRNGESTEMVTTVDESNLVHKARTSTDAPSGIYVADDGTWLAVAPSEHSEDSTEHPDDGKYPVDSCADVEDAWKLAGHGDYSIEESTLENRIQRAARAQDCDVPGETEDSTDCPCDTETETDMTNEDDTETYEFDVTVDTGPTLDDLTDEFDTVEALRDERDALESSIDEMEQELRDAFDEAEHFEVSLDEDECPCDAVDDLVADLDEKAEEVSDLRDRLDEFETDRKEELLSDLDDLGADVEEWEDDDLDTIEEEVQRREEVLDEVDGTSTKNAKTTNTTDDPDTETTFGRRTFGRGHGA